MSSISCRAAIVTGLALLTTAVEATPTSSSGHRCALPLEVHLERKGKPVTLGYRIAP